MQTTVVLVWRCGPDLNGCAQYQGAFRGARSYPFVASHLVVLLNINRIRHRYRRCSWIWWRLAAYHAGGMLSFAYKYSDTRLVIFITLERFYPRKYATSCILFCGTSNSFAFFSCSVCALCRVEHHLDR